MTQIASTPPRTIRARIHDSAIRRVTRIYASTLSDVMTEALQNSRRADATWVRIAVGTLADQSSGEPRFTVTIADDGSGIADPAVLLSFGENGWSEDLVRREDAAGFGFASLSRRGCTVSSRPRSPDGQTQPGWRVDLAPEHFPGESEAEVRPDDSLPRTGSGGAPFPHGTSISFEATESAAAIRHAAEAAARHYPLPVIFEGIPGTEPGGETNVVNEQLERRAFLDGAVHAEPWRGLAFGVFRNRNRGYNDPDLNFFGLTLPVGLPTIETVHGGTWSVHTDIGDCPDLELVLPARKEAVENDFLKEMRSAARLSIYRAMAADTEPRPAYADWKRARDAGIDTPPPPAVLRPWRPGIADVDDWREPPKLAAAGRDALVMACDPEPPEAQALWRDFDAWLAYTGETSAPRPLTRREDTVLEETLYEEALLPVCSPALLAARGKPRGPAELRNWPLLYDLGWDADWSYWFARQGAPTPDLSRASGFRLYSMLVQAAANGLGAAIGRPMLIAHELERRVLVPLFDHQKEAPERCCLITTAASRQRPELRAFRAWILHEAALPPPAASGFPSQP